MNNICQEDVSSRPLSSIFVLSRPIVFQIQNVKSDKCRRCICYHSNDYVASEKPLQKSQSDITVIWVRDWFKWVDLFKISSLMSQFSTNKRIFSEFCYLRFSIIVDPQHHVSHSITTRSNNINSKQLSQSQVDPQVIKQFRCECL